MQEKKQMSTLCTQFERMLTVSTIANKLHWRYSKHVHIAPHAAWGTECRSQQLHDMEI